VRGQRSVALFALAALLLNYPLLALFSLQGRVFGVPPLFAYLFSVWALLIVLAALVVRSKK